MRIVPGLVLAALRLPPAMHADESFTVTVGGIPAGHRRATAGK